MDIIIDNVSGTPLHEQISAQIKEWILLRELRPGEALPSMRGLARELHISVITTKRAYEDLAREGLIESVIGKGSFVKACSLEDWQEQQLPLIRKQLQKAVGIAQSAGIPLEQVTKELARLFAETTAEPAVIGGLART